MGSYTELEEIRLSAAIRTFRLQPGQMLIVPPGVCRAILNPNIANIGPQLFDCHVIGPDEWCPDRYYKAQAAQFKSDDVRGPQMKDSGRTTWKKPKQPTKRR